MKKVLNFINEYGLLIILSLVFIGSCSRSVSETKKNKLAKANYENLMNEIKSLEHKFDSLEKNINKEIKIEGLKVEKRMIQSTDRKMLDVQRQTEIDKELMVLEK